jgi:hypothetical protein
MNKFEKLIEYIINEDQAKAKALFHQIVVEKSRDIYEGLQDAEMGGERLTNELEASHDEIDGDEFGEAEDELGDDLDSGADEFGSEEEVGDEFGGDEFGGEEDLGAEGDEGDMETRVMDLEDAIDELKAEFDELMAGEEGEADLGGEEDFGGEEGGDEFGGDEEEVSDFDGDDEEGVGQDELGDEAEGDGENKFGEASVYGGQTGNSKTMENKARQSKSPADLMREYVEKVGQNWPNGASEGDAVGSGGTKSPINSKSNVISGKNDMGGTSKNIAQGSAASDRDSNTGPKKPSTAYTKGEKKMGQDKYENSPGANTKGYKDKRTVKREQEGQTTKDSVPVVKKSFNPGGKPGF